VSERAPDTRRNVENHLVQIEVNGKPVRVEGPRVTGGDIKEAAIEQGLPIEMDFVLSEELPGGGTRIIGDNDVVTVTDRSRFTAVAPDDNS
jgi:hypothetical protein